MSALARQLDECLRGADLETARRVEQIVREALALAEVARGNRAARWPAGYFDNTAGSLAGEPMERPDQGQPQIRESW